MICVNFNLLTNVGYFTNLLHPTFLSSGHKTMNWLPSRGDDALVKTESEAEVCYNSTFIVQGKQRQDAEETKQGR